MKKIYIIALLGLLPFSAKAGEWEFEVSGQAKGLYGYTDVAERFEKKDQNNHGVGIGEINTSAVYTSEDEEYGLGLYLEGLIESSKTTITAVGVKRPILLPIVLMGGFF